MPTREKISFTGALGESLDGLLEGPDGPSRATALFAHCFTCGKDVAAASRIARALRDRGYRVLRFDFTGLGGSDGDFANTNFSSNVQDLIAAANYLRDTFEAPQLLIGHSLGGTAILNAAHEVPECRAVVTIGSPVDAQHVAKQFHCDIPTIESTGEAEVELAGRRFTIRRQFLEDIAASTTGHIAHLKPALLVLHSPVDTMVAVSQAELIYRTAKHPKSFISLDDADHLLTRASDAEYAADVIAAWAGRFVPGPAAPPRPRVPAGEVVIHERDHVFLLDVYTDQHRWLADEPRRVGGSNAGPDPYEHLLAALGSCTVMTVRLYAERNDWPLENIKVTLRHEREHQRDCEGCDERPLQLDVITRSIELVGELDPAMHKRLMVIADKCPVHRTLTGKLEIRTRRA